MENFAANGPGMFLRAVLEVRYGTRKKRRIATGKAKGEKRRSTTAIAAQCYLGWCRGSATGMGFVWGSKGVGQFLDREYTVKRERRK